MMRYRAQCLARASLHVTAKAICLTSALSKSAASFSFGPAYCSWTCRMAAFKYTLHRIFVPPFPSRVPQATTHYSCRVCASFFSHSRLDFLVCGAILLHKRDPFLYGPPGLAFKFATHFPSSPRPGALRTANRFSRQLLSACRHLSTSLANRRPNRPACPKRIFYDGRTGPPELVAKLHNHFAASGDARS